MVLYLVLYIYALNSDLSASASYCHLGTCWGSPRANHVSEIKFQSRTNHGFTNHVRIGARSYHRQNIEHVETIQPHWDMLNHIETSY